MGSYYWTWCASRIHDSISNRATNYIIFSADESASQCVGSAANPASAPASQPAVTPTSVPSPASPSNVSAPWPTPQQQNLAMILQPKSPTEILANRFPHANGVIWVFHDLETCFVHHVDVPNIPTIAQRQPNQRIA